MSDDQRQPAGARPHLIHIGHAKTGSSFLRAWFADHPEIGYRDGRFAGLSGFEDVAAKADVVRLRVTSSENFAAPAISGDAPKSGAFRAAQARVCENLAGLFGGAQILLVTRGYRSMILSSYSQYVRSGGAKSLEELVADAQREDPWNYDTLVAMYAERFGRENVMVLPWELLRDSPERFVRQIEARFGLSHVPPPPQRINRSLSPAEMRWYPRFAAAIGKAPVGTSLKARLAKRFARLSHSNRLAGAVRLLQRAAPAPPVAPEALSAAALEPFRGQASSRAADPLFVPYAADYLNGPRAA